jgi:hypothetical protein
MPAIRGAGWPGPLDACGVLWVRGAGHRRSGVDCGPGWRSGPLRCLPGPSGCRAGCPEGCSVGVGMPGRKGNATGNSVQSPVTGLSAAQRARKLGRGARRGASERRSRAITSDIERLKLLVERHPATSGDGPNLYGMQGIYWSRKALTSIWTGNGSLVLSVCWAR